MSRYGWFALPAAGLLAAAAWIGTDLLPMPEDHPRLGPSVVVDPTSPGGQEVRPGVPDDSSPPAPSPTPEPSRSGEQDGASTVQPVPPRSAGSESDDGVDDDGSDGADDDERRDEDADDDDDD